ncbi:MAG TPA: Na+/H+ antiporter subunit E [Wenzhouxiangellaceae bacterium]|nr:Na+/H+ antiporter subunit E [Wenzhouxiangellaceae bacterium]
MSLAEAQGGTTIRSRITWATQGFFVLFALWLVFDGLDGWPFGLLAALIGGGLAAWLAEGRPFWWNPFRLVEFAGFFVFESFRGGIDVAWRSLDPRLPVMPRFFDYEIALPEGQPSTLLISTISLLPGTLSAELMRGEHVLVVHSLSPGGERSVSRLEARIARLFSLSPQDAGGAR